MSTIHSTDHMQRINEINNYVAEQIAGLTTEGFRPDDVAEYLMIGLRADPTYKENKSDERTLYRAVFRILL